MTLDWGLWDKGRCWRLQQHLVCRANPIRWRETKGKSSVRRGTGSTGSSPPTSSMPLPETRFASSASPHSSPSRLSAGESGPWLQFDYHLICSSVRPSLLVHSRCHQRVLLPPISVALFVHSTGHGHLLSRLPIASAASTIRSWCQSASISVSVPASISDVGEKKWP